MRCPQCPAACTREYKDTRALAQHQVKIHGVGDDGSTGGGGGRVDRGEEREEGVLMVQREPGVHFGSYKRRPSFDQVAGLLTAIAARASDGPEDVAMYSYHKAGRLDACDITTEVWKPSVVHLSRCRSPISAHSLPSIST